MKVLSLQSNFHLTFEYFNCHQVAEMTGLSVEKGDISISEDGLNKLIRHYCRESGVRNLRKHIEKIFRKAAYINVSEKKGSGIKVEESNLYDFVGKPVFAKDKMYESTPPGVVMGLAWTSHGGSTLYIETIKQKRRPKSKESESEESGSGNIQFTGNL